MIGIAKACNLNLRLVTATESALGNLGTGEFAFNANVFTIEVSGKLSDILDFVDSSNDMSRTNGSFKTSAMAPVVFTIPQPLTQAVKDQMRQDLYDAAYGEKDALITGADRIALIEQALLELLGGKAENPTLAAMTQQIHDIVLAQFGETVANLLDDQITAAIEQDLADTLISRIVTIYTQAITAQFTETNTTGLVPVFTGFVGTLGTETLDALINAAIAGVPLESISKPVSDALTTALNNSVAAQIKAKINVPAIDAALAAQITASELPSASLTVAVYSYKGA